MNYRELGNATIQKPQGAKLFYKEGTTEDIATKVLRVFKEQRHQVDKLAPHLIGATLYDTCRNIWNMVKQNIAYQMDPVGNQWVRRPAQMWWAGVGDCKSYSVFIASCLDRLGIAGTFRFVSYEPIIDKQPLPPPTHVYVVVKNNGSEIVLDAVMPQFNQEKPYSIKYDYNMTRIYELAGTATNSRKPAGTVIIRRAGNHSINGGLSTALNKNARRQLFADSLPGLAMLSLYQFIPSGPSGDWEKAVPGIATTDNLLQYMPQVVKDKRNISFTSFWDMGDWADWKVEQDVFPKLRTELKKQLGMDPTDWWRTVINQYCKATANMMGIGFVINPATVAAAVPMVKDMLNKVKNLVGNLFGGSDFKWRRGAPDTWAPDQADWNGYPCVPLNFLQIGKGVPVTGTGQVGWNDILNTNAPVQQQQPGAAAPYLPPAANTNQAQPAAPPATSGGSNTGMIIAAVALVAVFALKK